jgi:hypothetical protein
MPLVVKDRVRETSTSTGTGDIILNGAVQAFQDFSVIGDGNTTYYTIVDATTGAFEVGIGTYTLATTTLSRDTVLESSNAGAAVNFAANVKDVFVTYPAERAVYGDAGNVVSGYTISGGSINNTPIGATTPSTVASTNLSYTGTLTGGTGVINIGSGQVYKDASGNLGIGTSSPGVLGKLNVTSGFAATDTNERPIAFLSSSDSAIPGSSPSGLYLAYTGNASAALRKVEIAAATFGSGTLGVLSFQLGKMVITSAGNVGIGTTSPVSALELYSDNPRITLSDLGTQATITNLSGNLYYDTSSANRDHIFQGAGTEAARITGDGLVGIGTSSPTMKLDISGTSYGGVYIKSTSTNYSGLLLENTNSATKWQIGVEGGTYNTAGKLNIGIDAVGPAIIIDSSRNVGIGTSSPAVPLHINGSNGELLRLSVTSDGGTQQTFGLGFATGNTNTHPAALISAEEVDASDSRASLLFYTRDSNSDIAPTERLRITSTGSVGIGTSTPGAKLTVKLGNIGIDQDEAPQQFFGAGGNVAGTNTTGGVLTVFGHAPNGVGDTSTPPYDGTNFVGAAGLMARGFSESAQYRGSLEFFTKTASAANATSRMIITHDGNVGIGTSSANKSSSSTALTVNAPSAANYAALELSSGDTLNWHINSNNAAVYDVTGGTRPRIFYTNGSERLRIDSSGNVGIGTSSPDTSPSTKLHIREDDAVDYKARAVVQATDQRLVAGSHWQSGVAAYSYLQATNDAENVPNDLLLNPDGGNVGIGTSSPSGKFHIVGSTYDYLIGFGANEDNYYSCGSSGVHVFRNGATEQARIDASGNFKFNSGYGSAATAYGCRAWVNFDGTGTVAIRASGNVSSITDNGTGDYTVNFTTAMPDANYACVAGYTTPAWGAIQHAYTYTTSNVRIEIATPPTPTYIDASTVTVVIFR